MEPHRGVTHKFLILRREYFITRHHLELYKLIVHTMGKPFTQITSFISACVLSSLCFDPNMTRSLILVPTNPLLLPNNNSRLSLTSIFSP